MNRPYILSTPTARANCIEAIKTAPAGWEAVLKPQTRSSEANSRMWAMLAEISEQVEWYGQRLTPEEWKNVFSASLKKQKVVPGLDGGFVVMGQATSKMSRAEMAELQTLMEAFGAEKNVKFRAVE